MRLFVRKLPIVMLTVVLVFTVGSVAQQQQQQQHDDICEPICNQLHAALIHEKEGLLSERDMLIQAKNAAITNIESMNTKLADEIAVLQQTVTQKDSEMNHDRSVTRDRQKQMEEMLENQVIKGQELMTQLANAKAEIAELNGMVQKLVKCKLCNKIKTWWTNLRKKGAKKEL